VGRGALKSLRPCECTARFVVFLFCPLQSNSRFLPSDHVSPLTYRDHVIPVFYSYTAMSAILRGALPSLCRPRALPSVSFYSLFCLHTYPAQRAATTLSAGFPRDPPQSVSISHSDIPIFDITFRMLKNTVVSTLYALALIAVAAS